MSFTRGRVVLLAESKNTFTLFLVDEFGRPLSLSGYSAGKLVFLNCAGVRTEITLTVPGANPDKGEIPVIITTLQAADMDAKWKDADVELTSAGPETTIIPLEDAFEIKFRKAPPIV